MNVQNAARGRRSRLRRRHPLHDIRRACALLDQLLPLPGRLDEVNVNGVRVIINTATTRPA